MSTADRASLTLWILALIVLATAAHRDTWWTRSLGGDLEIRGGILGARVCAGELGCMRPQVEEQVFDFDPTPSIGLRNPIVAAHRGWTRITCYVALGLAITVFTTAIATFLRRRAPRRPITYAATVAALAFAIIWYALQRESRLGISYHLTIAAIVLALAGGVLSRFLREPPLPPARIASSNPSS